MPRELLLQLEVRRTLLDAHRLSLVATCHYAAVIIRQYDHGNALQVWPEDTFAAHVAIVQVGYSVHLYIFSKVRIK